MARRKDSKQPEPVIETGAAQNAVVPAAPASPERTHARSYRFALLAASVALASAFGALAGSFGLTATARMLPDPAKAATMDETHVVQASIAQLSAELAALKASVEASSKSASGQFTRIAERIERAERAHGEPAARLAKIAETLERLDRRAASAPETTGSVPTPAAPAESKAPVEIKAAVESKEASKPAIVAGWIIRDVYRGRIALLENRYGVYEVEPGSNVPGVGRVESIKRQDGHWVVVTPKGLITSYR